eukprot:4024565-Prorocentrum_lima.AAC.1
MTSSLVGSEMCIRDRCREHPMRQQSPGRTPPGARCLLRLAHIGGKHSACLLYTSDAADDM